MSSENSVQYNTMLTTHDNPYNPFEQFNEWFMFDAVEKGYNTCGHLARVADIEPDMSQIEVDRAIEEAIDIIIKNDFLNMYKKVTPETAKQTEPIQLND